MNEGYKTIGDETFLAGDGFVRNDFYDGVGQVPGASDEDIEKLKDAGASGGTLLALGFIPIVFMLGIAGIVGSIDRGEGAGNAVAIGVFFTMLIGIGALIGGARRGRDRLAERYLKD